MTNERVRAAVIGCGQVSRFVHVPDYATCGAAELVALCDPQRELAESLAAQWAPGARIYTNFREMLAREEPEAVTVAVPNRLHAEVTIAALDGGAHVLVEKPMTTSVADAREMIAAAEDAGRLLMVNQSQRLYPEYVKAREVVQSGLIGEVLLVTAMFGHDGPEHWNPASRWFFTRSDAGLGAMADLGVHKADVLRFVLGREIVEVSAYSGCLDKSDCDVEDNFVATLRFDDGALGTLVASWTTRGCTCDSIVLHGTRGTLRVNEPGNPLTAYLENPKREVVVEPPYRVIRYEGSWGIDVSGHFVRAIRGLEAPFCTADDAERSLEVILAAAESAHSARSIRLAGARAASSDAMAAGGIKATPVGAAGNSSAELDTSA